MRWKTRALQRRQKKMLNARVAKNVALQRRQAENVQLTRVTQEKNAERAASKKETRACSEVTT
jgi:hypothetical protein